MKKGFLLIIFVLFLTACIFAQPFPAATLPPTNEPIPPTATLEPTPTPIPNVDFTGSLFFDYNGSDLWDEGEPPISGFGVCAKHSSREWVCTETNEQGDYLFEVLAPVGKKCQ